jgi:hypothetical protein
VITSDRSNKLEHLDDFPSLISRHMPKEANRMPSSLAHRQSQAAVALDFIGAEVKLSDIKCQ